MKTSISLKNPFGYTRYSFAFENIKDNSKCLDFGCYDGKFMKLCKDNKNIDFIGVDRNLKVVKINKFDQNILHINTNNSLPFESLTFNTVTLLDVIEHIYDQDAVLSELNRIMKVRGNLIVTVPGKHIFSFLDTGNFKFIFPGIHKFIYTIKNSAEDYDLRYKNNPNGLIGDIECEKAWHQHFSKKDLAQLLEKNGFVIVNFDGTGLFSRLFSIFSLLKLNNSFLKKWHENDLKKNERSNLFCNAIKK